MMKGVFVLVFVGALVGVCIGSDISWESKKGVIMKDGERFYIKGVNWYGFETSVYSFHGLWANDYHEYFKFLQKNKFNALRIPLSLDLVLGSFNPAQYILTYCDHYGSSCNKDLVGKTSLETLDVFIKAANEYGMYVMLDMHSLEPNNYYRNGLWYDSTHTEQDLINGWDVLINRYNNSQAVFAADIFNEPFLATWGAGDNNTDWNVAAERIGSNIASQTNWLVFVQGTATSPICRDACFYGEDLKGALLHPVGLSISKRLVYSPHTYGPSVYPQPYFDQSDFPINMDSIWTDHFGFIKDWKQEAVVLGEWGGPSSGANGDWESQLVKYLKSKDMTDNFFWSMNADGGDLGGLLLPDWNTPDQSKLNLLDSLVPDPSSYN